MPFTLSFPAYVYVESVATDATGGTTFTNPLAITFKLADDKPAIVAFPLFTAEAKAVAFRPATNPPSSRWLKLATPNHLIDFLTKARGPATHVVVDPSANTLTTERLCTIEALLEGFKKLAAKPKAP